MTCIAASGLGRRKIGCHIVGRIAVDAAYCYRPSIAWSVGLSVTVVSPAKTAQPIEMPFGLRTWVGPKNRVC